MASPVRLPMSASAMQRHGDLRRELPDTRNYWLTLPPEITVCIFEELTTVEQLWSLACCSRLHWSVFRQFGTRILERVLKDDTHPWIRNVIHTTFNIQALDSRHWSYDELRHVDSFQKRAPLSTRAKPALVLRFVTKARKIHAMTHVILENCMKNLWSLEDKLRPADPEEGCSEVFWYLDTEANPGEETRAVMGLWLCELHATLIAVYRVPNHPYHEWVRAAFMEIHPEEETSVFDFFRMTWFGTLLTIWHGVLALIYSQNVLDREFVDHPDWPTALPLPKLPKGALESGLRCTTELPNYTHRSARSMFDLAEMCKVMRQKPLMHRFFDSIRAHAPREDDLHCLPYRAYLKYGVFHWDPEKLDSLNLIPCGDLDRYELYRYWKSFLPEWLVAEYAKAQADRKTAHWQEMDRHVAQGQPLPEPTDDAYYDDVCAADVESEAEEDTDEPS